MIDRQIQTAIQQSVQTADVNTEKPVSGITTSGDFFFQWIEHPDIIAPWGYRARDLALRRLSYTAHNGLFQGAVSGLIMRVVTTPWEVKGGRNLAKYYQSMLQNSDFHDWESWIEKTLWDFFTQDFGALTEIIGQGKPDKKISGRVTGIAHMDSLSCMSTRNAEFPVIYWNEEDGSMHKLHHSRVERLTDMRSPRRLAYGNGLCALSRYVSESNVDVLLGRHDNEMLNDLPPAGLLTVQGMTEQAWQDAIRLYEAGRRQDGESVFRSTLVLHAIDPTNPLKVETIPFSTLPEGFDTFKFIESHVNKLALALGVDPQDIWPLSGSSLGTGTQSEILHAKAQGKMFGRVLQMITRFLNRKVLPEEIEFQFKFKDTEEDAKRVETAKLHVELINGITFLTDEQKARYLADNVESLADVLLDEAGELIELPDDDPKPNEVPDIIAPDDNPTAPPPADGNQPPVSAGDDNPNAAPVANPTIPPAFGQRGMELDLRRGGLGVSAKDYDATRDAFTDEVAAIIADGASGEISAGAFSIRMRAAINKYGKAAYLDGMESGGVEADSLTGADSETFARLLAGQSAYVTSARGSITDFGGDAESRAEMWSNKTLQPFFDAGQLSADKNGMYEWQYGATEEHCADCKRLQGQKHRLQEWHDKGWLPKASKLECNGYRCDCRLIKTTGRARGGF